MLGKVGFALAATLVCGMNWSASAATLDDVREKGFISCGVSQGLPGFSSLNSDGKWEGLDVDYCRALAAATLGDAGKVKFVPLSGKERFTALQSGEIDILSRNTTWTASRDSVLGVNFVGVLYYDGQGMMIRKSLGINSAYELDGATFCVGTGTTTELNLTDFLRSNDLKGEMVVFEKADEVIAAYEANRCDVYSTDQSGLYGYRLKLTDLNDHLVLPEIISKEPLGPAVRQGDDQWFNIAKWTLAGLVNAEEMDITSENIDTLLDSENPAVRRFLGKEGSIGTGFGVSDDWMYKAIKQIGNYSEIFERNVGQDTPLGIARGVNALWTEGGILYAPPFR